MAASAPPAAAAPAARAASAWATTPAASVVEVWLDLSEPPLASLARGDLAGRAALRRRIEQQQDAVLAQLSQLGAREIARVQQLRNSVAVHLPRAALEAARRTSGVLRLRVVRNRQTDTP